MCHCVLSIISHCLGTYAECLNYFHLDVWLHSPCPDSCSQHLGCCKNPLLEMRCLFCWGVLDQGKRWSRNPATTTHAWLYLILAPIELKELIPAPNGGTSENVPRGLRSHQCVPPLSKKLPFLSCWSQLTQDGWRAY